MVDKQLLYVTTLITTECKGNCYSATGFFFHMNEPVMTKDRIGNYWLVTNRHAIYAKSESDQKHHLVEKLTFRVRAEEKSSNKLIWIEMTMSQIELQQKAKVLSDSGIDVAVIDICEKVEEELKKYDNIHVTICPITESSLADKTKIPIEVSDDVVVIGYPGGYYDMANFYPIVKSGIIASMWNADFRGTKGFAIDAKLFPGSSGSLVITKPRMEDLDKHGHLVFKKDKVFYCLGIYSGEPLFGKIIIDDKGKPTVIQHTFDLGQVWYYYLIPETIRTGGIPLLDY